MDGNLTHEDDSLHPPVVADPYWSETHWFSFDQPGPNLSTTIYPVFRKNFEIAYLAVYLWDESAHEPWLARYGKAYWHLPYPEMDVTQLRLGDLEYDCVEPLKTWDVRYRDGEQVEMQLRFEGLREPHLARKTAAGGHFDQPCRVTGEVTLDGERIEIDTLGIRDKSWGVRPDARVGAPAPDGRTGATYAYGTRSADDQFLVVPTSYGNVGRAGEGSGYLVRDGSKALIAKAERRVLKRENGHPVELMLDLEDVSGRTLHLLGTCRNRLANQALPTTFAWLSMTEWRTADGETFLGEDQEVFGPYASGPRMSALNIG